MFSIMLLMLCSIDVSRITSEMPPIAERKSSKPPPFSSHPFHRATPANSGMAAGTSQSSV